MQSVCVRYFVSGRVQGVWFRAGAQEAARALGLTGWVRNLPDGRVEVLACGEQPVLAAMRAWLHQGPEGADVTLVTEETLPFENHAQFWIRR